MGYSNFQICSVCKYFNYNVCICAQVDSRLSQSRKFFSPYRIYKGEFCIHNALYLRQRNIPLNEIKRIEVHCAHGRGGKIYILNIERKNGKPTGSVIFGKSKRNDRLLEKLEEDAQKYHIQISKETWD